MRNGAMIIAFTSTDIGTSLPASVVLAKGVHMNLPDYWLTRPSVSSDENTRRAFDALLGAASGPDCTTLRSGPWPKWRFLCHAVEQHDLVLHGSGEPDIQIFEPRQSQDVNEFGNQRAVYAAADGIWAMFFAIVDRTRVRSVSNACMRMADEAGNRRGPYYVFSVSRDARPNEPWRSGTVYLMPRRTFTMQPSVRVGALHIEIPQLASTQPVRPLAKLEVGPEDFPFLRQIRGHDDERLAAYSQAIQTGAPWPDDT
jgi:hypothetical protein